MVFFDRSWYNRAIVEPAMGFCTKDQYYQFMEQVNPFEKMLLDDGIILVKFWFSIGKEDQQNRIQRRLDSPLARWKVSHVDLVAQEKWEAFTNYKNTMFEHTHRSDSPWMIVRGESREDSRIQAMRYVLSLLAYDGKSGDLLPPDKEKVFRWKYYK